MHPSTRLVIWLLAVVAFQGLDGGVLVGFLLLVALSGGLAWRQCGQIVWGARWLFLSLFVILAWGRAGEPAWSGAMAPSLEGLAEAGTHVGRLLLVLMAVAVLRERMPVAELLTAIHRLLEPIRRAGLDPDRGLVRLLLVLRHIETMPRPRNWRLLLDEHASAPAEVFELADCQLARRDFLIMGLAALGTLSLVCYRLA